MLTIQANVLHKGFYKSYIPDIVTSTEKLLFNMFLTCPPKE
jgi:hypothetical protein